MIAIYIPIERYPQNLHTITRLNPLFVYPDIARKLVLNNQFIISEFVYGLVWAVISMTLGIIVFVLNENRVARKIG